LELLKEVVFVHDVIVFCICILHDVGILCRHGVVDLDWTLVEVLDANLVEGKSLDGGVVSLVALGKEGNER
jgi:hypothetical protein